MKDLKIKVNNEAESKEVRELLFELGFQWRGLKSPFDLFYPTSMDNYYIVLTKGSKEMQIAGAFRDGLGAWKEITLAELRAMAYPVKEYLNKTTYEYKLAHSKPYGEWVEIPVGANYAYKDEPNVHFTKLEMGYRDLALIWIRLTQPEALPFIDDNPQSLNEQYAEIEQVRQAIKVKSGSDSDHMADAMSYGLMGGIDATLAERQSTYGNFEDVAFVTENIMSVLGRVRVNGLSELPNTHRMALYMIASKMARIVNGDFNHFDSWHDIGGYAKLVEDLIKENNNG